jgi:hypothetical protein
LVSGFVAVAGFVFMVAGSATAFAQPGYVDCQSGCAPDYDGTQGSFDQDGTTGTSRGLATSSSGSHSIVVDACFIKGGKGCVDYGFGTAPGYDASTIAETTGVSGALDADGYQDAGTRGPIIVAKPGIKATPGTSDTASGGFYYPH